MKNKEEGDEEEAQDGQLDNVDGAAIAAEAAGTERSAGGTPCGGVSIKFLYLVFDSFVIMYFKPMKSFTPITDVRRNQHYQHRADDDKP